MNKKFFKDMLTKSAKFHGDLCLGLVLGTRIALAGLDELKTFQVKNKDLIVFVEMDRCVSDAIQAITGCSLGKRRLKFRDYGKFAASFLDMSSGKGVRVSIKSNIPKMTLDQNKESDLEGRIDEVVEKYSKIEDSSFLKIETVEIFVSENDLPGRPKCKIPCSNCGEMIFDNKGVDVDNKILCKACFGEGYYRFVGDQ